MERIFWAECRKSHGKFYCSYRKMRHTGVTLLCPKRRARAIAAKHGVNALSE
jgi:hypothetical protein